MARTSDRVYGTLRAQILDWSLPPGAPLAEVELAERLEVSRTPLRTALSRLAAEGLVARGGRGLVVAQASVNDLRDVYEVRQALEGRAARLAAARGDEEVFAALAAELGAYEAGGLSGGARDAYYDLVARMDGAIDVAAGNGHLVAALRSLRTHVARLRRLSQDDPARLAAAAREHRLIAEAVRDGDGELAEHAVHVHLHASLQAALARLGPPDHRPADHRTARPAPTLQEDPR